MALTNLQKAVLIEVLSERQEQLQIKLLEQLRWIEQVAGVEFVDKFEEAGACAEIELAHTIDLVLFDGIIPE